MNGYTGIFVATSSVLLFYVYVALMDYLSVVFYF